jgi:hypothetical protein
LGIRVKLREDSHPGCLGRRASSLPTAQFRNSSANKQAGSPLSITGRMPVLHPCRYHDREFLR